MVKYHQEGKRLYVLLIYKIQDGLKTIHLEENLKDFKGRIFTQNLTLIDPGLNAVIFKSKNDSEWTRLDRYVRK